MTAPSYLRVGACALLDRAYADGMREAAQIARNAAAMVRDGKTPDFATAVAMDSVAMMIEATLQKGEASK